MERDPDFKPDDDDFDEDEFAAQAELEAEEVLIDALGGTKSDRELDTTRLTTTLRTAFQGRVYDNLQTAPVLSLQQAWHVLNGGSVPVGDTRCALYRIVDEKRRLKDTQDPLLKDKEGVVMPDYLLEGKDKTRQQYRANVGQALVLDERIAFALMRWVPFSEFIKDPTEWRGSLTLDPANPNYFNFITAWRSSVAFDRIQELRHATGQEFAFFVDRWAAAYYYILYLDNPYPSPEDDFYGLSWILHARSWYEQLMTLYGYQQTRVKILPFAGNTTPFWLYPNGIVPFEERAIAAGQQQLSHKPESAMSVEEKGRASGLILHREELRFNDKALNTSAGKEAAGKASMADSSVEKIPFRIASVEPAFVELQRNLVFRVDISNLTLSDGQPGSATELTNGRPQIEDIVLLNKHTSPLPGFTEAAGTPLKLLVVQLSVLFEEGQSSDYQAAYSYESRLGSAHQWWRHRTAPTAEQLETKKSSTVVVRVRANARQLQVVPETRKYIFTLDAITVRVPTYFDPRNGIFKGKTKEFPDYANSFLNQNNQVIFYMTSTATSVATQQSLASFASAVNLNEATNDGFQLEVQNKVRQEVATAAINPSLPKDSFFRQFLIDETFLVGAEGATLDQKIQLQKDYVKNLIFFVRRVDKSTKITKKKKGEQEASIIQLESGDWEVYFSAQDKHQADALQDTQKASNNWFPDTAPPPKSESQVADEDSYVSWQQLWNGAVINCVQRCAFRCTNSSSPQTPASAAIVSDTVTIECNEDILNPSKTGESSVGFLGPSVPDDRHVLTVDLLLTESETAETGSRGSPYQVASELIMEENYEPLQTGELKSISMAEVRSSPLERFFFTAMRQTGAAVAIRSALTNEPVRNARSDKAADKQRSQRVRTELVIENPKTKLSMLINGKGGVNEKLGRDLEAQSWDRQTKLDREQETELVRKQKEELIGTTGGTTISKEDQARMDDLARQIQLKEEADEAAAAAAQRSRHERAIKSATMRSKQYQQLDKLPLNESTRNAIKRSWLGFVFAYGEERTAEPAEKELQTNLEIALPPIYPPGTPGVEEWKVLIRSCFNETATPAGLVEDSLRRQTEIVPTEPVVSTYQSTDPQALLDAIRYARARFEDQKRKANQQSSAPSSGTILDEEEQVTAPVSDADILRRYAQLEWERIAQIAQHFKFDSQDISSQPLQNVFFSSFGRALATLLVNSYQNEKNTGAENVILYTQGPGQMVSLQDAIKTYKLEDELAKEGAYTFHAKYLRLKLAQWFNSNENREFLVTKMPYYQKEVPLTQEVTKVLLFLNRNDLYAVNNTIASLWVLQALCQIFLVRVVVMFSPESLDQVDAAVLDAATASLTQRSYGHSDRRDNLLQSDLMQFVVFEPQASTAPVGWFRTIYAGAVVVPTADNRSVLHIRALKAIKSFSDEKISKTLASRIAQNARIAQLNVTSMTSEVIGEELAIQEAGGYSTRAADPYSGDYVEEDIEKIPGGLSTADLTEITINLRELPRLLVADAESGLRSRYQSIHDNTQITEFIRISITDAPHRLRNSDVRFLRLRVRIVKREIEERPLVAYIRREREGAVRYLGDRRLKDFSLTSIEQQEFWFALLHNDSDEVVAIPVPWAPMRGKFMWPCLVEHLPPELPLDKFIMSAFSKRINDRHRNYLVGYFQERKAEKEKTKKAEEIAAARRRAELKVRMQMVQISTTATLATRPAPAASVITTTPPSSAPRPVQGLRLGPASAPKSLFAKK